MSATLDGEIVFDEQELKIELGSMERGSIERTVSGLDGVLSIDLGARGRKIKQSGVLRAQSRSQMNRRISVMSACMDGDMHTLVADDKEFDGVRMDVFRVSKERTSGSGLCCDYEIIYTQLVV
jgi:hypothetical protein